MKIANKISLSFLVTAFVLTSIAVPILYLTSKDKLEESIINQLLIATESRSSHIITYLESNKEAIVQLSKSVVVKRLLLTDRSDKNYKQRFNDAMKRLKETSQAGKHVFGMCVADANGIIIASSVSTEIGKDKSSEGFFLSAKKGEDVFIKDVHICMLEKQKCLGFSASIKDKDNRLLGVVYMRFLMATIDKITINRTGMGKTGEIYLANKSGFVLTPLRFKKDTFLKQTVNTINLRSCLMHKTRQHKAEGRRISVFKNYRGVRVLGTHEYIPQTRWCLLAEISEKEVFAPLARIKFLFFIIMLFIPTAGYSMGFFISRAITGPIQKLRKGIEVIGRGNLNYKTNIRTGDEIGRLSMAFDKMTEDLKKTTTSLINLNKEITERKRMQEQQKELMEDLEVINKELDDFTYIVSHDLKEPLRSIDAFSKFIEDDYKDRLDEQGKNYLERIRVSAGRMQMLIDDLLEISRIERKRNPLEEVRAEEFINEVKFRLEYTIKQRNAKIIIRDELPRIFCDRIRLTEVFLNLISNAVKFNDKPEPYIEIGSSEKGDFYEFYVKDNGPGIEARYFDKIFEIFQRLGKREEQGGTGAGLTIVKKIVQMHKGRIWVESKMKEGATFYFTIPKERNYSG